MAQTVKSKCVVPGCINLLQEWMTLFPRAARLTNRWITAIEVGTGQEVSLFQPQHDVQICNMHFVVSAGETTSEDEYREPTLFFRDNVLIQIASCELCFKFDMVNDMYKLSERIVSGDRETLYALAKKYFNFPKNDMKRGQYFCESCVIQIDMTHAFWQKTGAAWKVHKKALKLMTEEKTIFRQNGSILNNGNGIVVEMPPADTTISLDSSDDAEEANPAKVVSLDDSDNDLFEDIIVKEEPHVDLTEFHEQIPESTVGAGSTCSKCYICNISFQDRTHLTDHIQSIHSGKYKRSCKNCNSSFMMALNYNDHMATHQPYRCNYCPMEFGGRREVVIHEVQQHAGENKRSS